DRVPDPQAVDALHAMIEVADGPSEQDARSNQASDSVAGSGQTHKQRPTLTPSSYILEVSGDLEKSFLEKYVQKKSTTLKQPPALKAEARYNGETPLQRLMAARSQISLALDAISAADQVALAAFLRERCLVSIVITASRETGWDVFSRLNKRGRPLLESERLKSDILRDVKEPRRTELVRLWDDRRRQLGTAFEAGGARRKDLFSYIRDFHTPATGRAEDRILALAQDMGAEHFMTKVFEPMSRALCELTQKRFSTDQEIGHLHTEDGEVDDIAEMIGVLELSGRVMSANNIDVQDSWKAPVLLFFSKAGHDTALKKAFLRSFDRYLNILLMLHGKRKKSNIAKQIAQLNAQVIRDGANLDLEAAFFVPNLKQVTHNLVEALDGSVAKLVLLRVACATENLPISKAGDYLGGAYNIEHVLPERVTDNWSRMIGSDALAQKLRNNIGNLFITGQRLNSKLGNRTWEEKHRLLRQAKVLLPFAGSVRTAGRWGRTEILARQDLIVSQVSRMWGLIDQPWDPFRSVMIVGPEQIAESSASSRASGATSANDGRKVKPDGLKSTSINRPRRDYPPRIRSKRRSRAMPLQRLS
ncbi:MAG: HNH endonuclease family protein, partial [Pseudomonadota bacterium]